PQGTLLHETELAAVISDRLWRSRYHADPGIVGRQIMLNDRPYTVLGVMPPRFGFPGDIDVWERLRWNMKDHSRSAHFMEGVARLGDGVELARATSACDALARRLETDFASSNKAWAVRL